MRTGYVRFLRGLLILFGAGLAAFAVFLLPYFAELAAQHYGAQLFKNPDSDFCVFKRCAVLYRTA